MLPLILAEAVTYIETGIVVVGLGSLASLGVSVMTLARLASGKANERRIEPTTLAALQQEMRRQHEATKAELGEQTKVLGKLDRESGETKKVVESVAGEVSELKRIQREDVDKVHMRLSGISRELASTTARVEGLEKRESKA